MELEEELKEGEGEVRAGGVACEHYAFSWDSFVEGVGWRVEEG
jgi:hypothetical protein